MRGTVRVTPFEIEVSKTTLLEGRMSAAGDDESTGGVKVSVGVGSAGMEGTGSVMTGAEGSSTDEEEEAKPMETVAINGIKVGFESETETDDVSVTGSELGGGEETVAGGSETVVGGSETVVGDSETLVGGEVGGSTITEEEKVELSVELGGSDIDGSSPTDEFELELGSGIVSCNT